MENDIDEEYFQKIKLKRNTSVPIYRQIVDFVDNGIAKYSIKAGNRLPSINEASREKHISRHTVEKAYKILRQKGVIQSIPGSGYFINKVDKKKNTRVVVLINKSSPHKSEVFDSICHSYANINLGLEIHFVEEEDFQNKIDECKNFSDYLFAVSFVKDDFSGNENNKPTNLDVGIFQPDCNIFLDRKHAIKDENISFVYQNIETDFYKTLQRMSGLSKYDKLILVLTTKNINEKQYGIKPAFVKFCNDHCYRYEVRSEIKDNTKIERGEAFFVFDELNLVELIRLSERNKFTLGTDIGIISHKDSPLREIMGISVISIDYKLLGELIVSIILKKIRGNIKNEYVFIDRGSA